MAFLPLATSFVEKSASGMGLGQKETTALSLATEEIFAYLSRNSGTDQEIEIRSVDGKYYIEIIFSCSVRGMDLRLFNITSSVSPDDQNAIEQMGLLIASRFVDRLNVEKTARGILLSLFKDKSYPAIQGTPPAVPASLPEFVIEKPQPDVLKILCGKILSHYPERMLPNFFRYPGKLVDMFACGEYDAAVSLGPQGQIGGGIVWYWASRKTVGFLGPYVFGESPDESMTKALLDACISSLGKSPAVALVNLFPINHLSGEQFEILGTIDQFDEKGSGSTVTAFFRQMHEDPGSSSWCHPELETFLREQYERLFLPREIMPVRDQGETGEPYSVLSAQFDRAQEKVTLRPILEGKDAGENISDHLKLFRKEEIHNVFFEMDLGKSWHTHFTPDVLRSGFTPRMVIPYGGDGDRVVFQLVR